MEDERLARIEGLLAEIRDLQRAHFERYKEFTGRLMESDEKNRQAAVEAAKTNDALVSDQRAYQEEMRRHVRNSHTHAVVASIVTAILVILLAGLLISGTFLP